MKLKLSKLKSANLVRPGWAIEFTVPCVVKSEANLREHWAVKHRRFKIQAHAVDVVIGLFGWAIHVAEPLAITFTRLGGKKLDDDNLSGSFKAVRDALCRRLGRDDGDEGLTFHYRQDSGNGPKGVRIRIEGSK